MMYWRLRTYDVIPTAFINIARERASLPRQTIFATCWRRRKNAVQQPPRKNIGGGEYYANQRNKWGAISLDQKNADCTSHHPSRNGGLYGLMPLRKLTCGVAISSGDGKSWRLVLATDCVLRGKIILDGTGVSQPNSLTAEEELIGSLGMSVLNDIFDDL